MLQATGSATFFYRAGDSIWLLTANGNYGNKGDAGRLSDIPFRESILEHVRFRRALLGGLGVEAFIQHEYDHIEGKLFTDRISQLKRRLLKNRLEDITKGKVDVRYKMKFRIR